MTDEERLKLEWGKSREKIIKMLRHYIKDEEAYTTLFCAVMGFEKLGRQLERTVKLYGIRDDQRAAIS